MPQPYLGSAVLRTLCHGLREPVHVAGGAVVNDGDVCSHHPRPLQLEMLS